MVMASTLSVAAVGAALAALVLYYMRIDAARRVRLSLGRFLGPLSPSNQRRRRWQPSRPLKSKLFLLRALILLLLLAAVLNLLQLAKQNGPMHLAVRLVIDTSYSLTARDGSGTRFDALKTDVMAVLKHIDQVGPANTCVEVQLVDSTVRKVDIEALRAQPDTVMAPRLKGGLPALLLKAATDSEPNSCVPTHAVVITDLPRPAQLDDRGNNVIWRQIGEQAQNIGFHQVHVFARPLSDEAAKVSVTLDGDADADSAKRRVSVTGPDGGTLAFQQPDFRLPGPWTIQFAAPRSGDYQLRLSGVDAYNGDDRATVSLTAVAGRSVAWQLKALASPKGLKPSHEAGAPVVMALSSGASDKRAVLTAGHWQDPPQNRLGLFDLGSEVLNDVDLDMFERYLPSPINRLPPDFIPIVTDAGGHPLIAIRQYPPAAIVPLPEADRSHPAWRVSWVVMLNALRWVSGASGPSATQQLFTPDGRAVENGQLETGFARALGKPDRLSAIAPVTYDQLPESERKKPPLAPWFVMVALALFLFERVIGVTWRKEVA